MILDEDAAEKLLDSLRPGHVEDFSFYVKVTEGFKQGLYDQIFILYDYFGY